MNISFKFTHFLTNKKCSEQEVVFTVLDPDPGSKNVADLTIYIG